MLGQALVLFILIHYTLSSELKFVQAIWRHGDRAPGKLAYPNDVYVESYWPLGWSQLTERGAGQMEDLGKFFRDRYVGTFTSDNFKPSEVYIRSSDADRALSSAQAFANGMFILMDCSTSRPMTPVPIHSSGVNVDDYLLKPTSTDCPAYDQHYETTSLSLTSSIEENYKLLYAFLGNVTGIGANMTTEQVAAVYNIHREISYNFTQPDWVYKIWPEYGNSSTLDLVTEIHEKMRINEFDDDKLAKLRGGFLLGDWLTRAKKVSKNEQENPTKMMLYSAHDGTLLSLLYAMELGDGESIPYAACLIMEIFQEDNESFVELFYHKNNETIPKTVAGCESPCSVDKLMQVLEANAVYDLDLAQKQCQLADKISEEDTKAKAKSERERNESKNADKSSSSSSSESNEKGSHGNKPVINFLTVGLMVFLFLTMS